MVASMTGMTCAIAGQAVVPGQAEQREGMRITVAHRIGDAAVGRERIDPARLAVGAIEFAEHVVDAAIGQLPCRPDTSRAAQRCNRRRAGGPAPSAASAHREPACRQGRAARESRRAADRRRLLPQNGSAVSLVQARRGSAHAAVEEICCIHVERLAKSAIKRNQPNLRRHVARSSGTALIRSLRINRHARATGP